MDKELGIFDCEDEYTNGTEIEIIQRDGGVDLEVSVGSKYGSMCSTTTISLDQEQFLKLTAVFVEAAEKIDDDDNSHLLLNHPVQPVYMDGKIARYKENAIARYLLDAGPFDMNTLACTNFSDEDREQFAQLIGYSVAGASDLSYVSERVTREGEKKLEKLKERKENDVKD